MKRIRRPIKSNLQISKDKAKIFSTEDLFDILDLIRAETGYDIYMETEDGGMYSIIIGESVYSFS